MKLFKVLGIIVAIAVMAFVASVAFNVAGVGSAILTAPGRVITQTLGTDNIISNYEWFHQQLRDIDTARSRYHNNRDTHESFVASLGDDRSSWAGSDRQEANRLQSIMLGSKNFYIELVNDYNARAAMLNRNIFRDQSLPEQVVGDL